MADRKVRYILEVDYAGEGVTARAADDLREVDDAAKEASAGLEQAEGGFSKVQASIVTMQSALGIAEQGFAAIQQAAEFAYQTLSEGAAIVDARGDFDDLAESIGTTADAMENELSIAAGGLLTDAQLISQAGELMALGLGLTKDEIVQLTGLAAELDWNFKTLTDTLNTGSTRGLKELGLSIDEVKGKMALLEERGMSTDEAFRWAIIEAAEEKLGRVGRKSEEASGQLQQLETVVANVQDEFARGSAEGFASTLAMIAGSAPAAGEALEAASRGAGYFIGQFAGYSLVNMFGSDLAWLIEKGRELEEEEERQARRTEEVTQARRDGAEMAAVYADAQEEVIEATGKGVIFAAEMAGEMGKLGDAFEVTYGKIGERDVMGGVAGDMAELGGILAELRVDIDEANAAWVAYTTEMTAWGGDTFTQMWQSEEPWNFAEAVYGAADAAGAGVGPLSDLAVALDLVDQGVADAAVDATARQAMVDSIAGAAVDGKILWEDYIATVERAQRVWSGEEVINMFPGPVSQVGPRAQLPEEDLRAMGENMPTFEVEITADTQAVLDAVDTAKGVVDGFTESNPEVTMFMNIDEVETKAGRATELIEGIPEVKNVRIDVTATGMEILEELRAMGALP